MELAPPHGSRPDDPAVFFPGQGVYVIWCVGGAVLVLAVQQDRDGDFGLQSPVCAAAAGPRYRWWTRSGVEPSARTDYPGSPTRGTQGVWRRVGSWNVSRGHAGQRGLEFHGGQNAPCSMLHARGSMLHALCSVPRTKCQYIHSTLGARPGSRKRPWPLDALNIRRDGCVSFHNGEAFLVPGRKAVRQRTGQDERPRACQGPNLDR